MSAELLALMTLRLTPQLGPRRIEALRRHFGSAEQALAAPAHAFREVEGLTSRSVTEIGNPKIGTLASNEIKRCKAAGVQLLGRGLAEYPAALEALSDPPPMLWARGNVLPLLPQLGVNPLSIGMVGTRAASPHALSMTRQLAAGLARLGVVVISGLARGIDTAAHTATVEAGGPSIAVLGSAVDVIYPSENTRLAAHEHLCLLSEYPLGTRPAQHHFPTRNRIIAALSAGVLVVEGERKSGSLITATHALECGRTVFAMPGKAADPRASGPHRLIREGAVLTESVEDILQEMHWQPQSPQPQSPQTPNQQSPQQAPPTHTNAQNLSGAQLKIWQALHTPSTLDDLQHQTNMSLDELHTMLVMLQLDGKVEELGGRWQRSS